ncbi:hypothetical protein TNCV_2774841 [Trichonephila clavipes]|nr:hypothetical protein TNCV_2774841 [Trichonephila clavipes]
MCLMEGQTMGIKTAGQLDDQLRIVEYCVLRVYASQILVKAVTPRCLEGPSVDSDRINAHLSALEVRDEKRLRNIKDVVVVIGCNGNV